MNLGLVRLCGRTGEDMQHMPNATRVYILRLIEIAILATAINNHYAQTTAKLTIWVIDMGQM